MRKYDGRTFGFASRNFYVEFLAALEVATDSNRYFGPLILDAPTDYEVAEVGYYAHAHSLARTVGVPVDVLKASNPALSKLVWSGEKFVPRGFPIRVPRSALARPLADAVDTMPAEKRYAAQTPDSTHRVRRGDTVSGIAARYGTSVREIMALNKLGSRHRIRVGQKLRLPYKGRGRSPRTVVASSEPPADGLYRVRRGDTVSKIAKRFGMSERQLTAQNQLRNSHRIYPGQSLRVVAEPKPAAPAEPASVVENAPVPPPSKAAVVAVPEPAAVVLAALQPEPASLAVEEPLPAVLADAQPEPLVLAAVEPEPEIASEAAAIDLDVEGSGRAPETDTAADASAAEAPDAGELERDLLADPSDYSVAEDGSIEVQSSETLGHIAEWLDVRASRLRTLNGLRYGQPLAVHKRLKLDFDRVTRSEFERRRLEHRARRGPRLGRGSASHRRSCPPHAEGVLQVDRDDHRCLRLARDGGRAARPRRLHAAGLRREGAARQRHDAVRSVRLRGTARGAWRRGTRARAMGRSVARARAVADTTSHTEAAGCSRRT